MVTYALLVGINDYRPTVGPLNGSVNDVLAVETYLGANVSGPLKIKKLLDSQATRQNIIDGFRSFLSRATADDVALFYYAGHGARWKSAVEFNSIYPDPYDEGLICYDSRGTSADWDLADKELAILVSELAMNDPHLAVIMDCCHSGSATRSADAVNRTVMRASHTIEAARPLDSYLDGFYTTLDSQNRPPLPPSGKHILMAACERFSRAAECRNMKRGWFTTSLIAALEQLGPSTSYAELFQRTRALLHPKALKQIPQFETYNGFNGWAGFLNNQVPGKRKRHEVNYEILPEQHWQVGFGVVHGASPGLDKPATFEIFPADDDQSSVGTATVSKVGINSCVLNTENLELDWQKTYRAELTSIPAAPLDVFIEANDANKEQLEKILAKQAVAVAWTDHRSAAELLIQITDKHIELQKPNGTIVQRVVGTSQESCEHVADLLKKIAHWHRIQQLTNPSQRAQQSQVEFIISRKEDGQRVPRDASDHTYHVVRQGEPGQDLATLQFKVRNKSAKRLHLMLVWLDESYGVHVLNNNPHDRTAEPTLLELDSGAGISEEVWFFLDENDGDHITQDFMVIASKDKIENFDVAQSSLFQFGQTVEANPTAARGHGFGGKPVDWFTIRHTVHIVRQVAEIGGQTVDLADGQIRIQSHPSFKANASLLPLVDATRSGTDEEPVQCLLSHGFAPLNFSNQRGGNQSILDLHGIQSQDSIHDQPLEIELDVPLSDEEYVVPVIHDGQHFRIAGETWKDDTGKTQIRIQEIPKSDTQERSVLSAAKLYFLKTVCGVKNVDQLVTFQIINDTVGQKSSGLGELIHQASNVLVLVHGLVGDSRSMFDELQLLKQSDEQIAKQLDQFDLVLGYNYETLNTPIEQSAQQLKQLLASKGLNAETQGKSLTLVGHSMGGLLTRWMVERESCQFVDHVVMIGTPNEGSPFANFAMAVSALSNLADMAINLIPGFAKSFIQSTQDMLKQRSLTTTLVQLSANSEFLRELNTSQDPGVPYTIIAGDVNRFVSELADDHQKSLIDKLGSSKGVRKLFKGVANDVAVSVDSARAVLDSRSPAPRKETIACHHLNYLTDESGLQCVRQMVADNVKESAAQ